MKMRNRAASTGEGMLSPRARRPIEQPPPDLVVAATPRSGEAGGAHAAPAHVPLAHGLVTPGVQPPLPSQVAAAVVTPATHPAAAQAVIDEGYLQVDESWPSQAPAHATALPSSHFGRLPAGAPVVGTQLPRWPARLHTAHGSVHHEEGLCGGGSW